MLLRRHKPKQSLWSVDGDANHCVVSINAMPVFEIWTGFPTRVYLVHGEDDWTELVPKKVDYG